MALLDPLEIPVSFLSSFGDLHITCQTRIEYLDYPTARRTSSSNYVTWGVRLADLDSLTFGIEHHAQHLRVDRVAIMFETSLIRGP